MSPQDRIFEKLKYANKIGSETAVTEQTLHEEGKKPHDIYGRGAYEYGDLFRKLIPEGLLHYCSTEFGSSQNPLALDAFGEGTYLRDLRMMRIIKGGVALTLSDLRSSRDKDYDQRSNIELIAANAYKGSTWKKVEKELAKQNSTGFSLIICAPAGGWRGSPGFGYVGVEIQKLITRKLWSLLSKNNGTLLISYPSNFFRDNAGPNWIEELKVRGIDVTPAGREVMFIKHQESQGL